MRRLDLILSKLEGVRKSGKQFVAKCPAHADNSPSLRVSETPDERILLHCFAGCMAVDVLGAIGLAFSDLYPERLADYLPSIRETPAHGKSDLEFERQYFLECQHRLRSRQPLTNEQQQRLTLAIKRLKAAA